MAGILGFSGGPNPFGFIAEGLTEAYRGSFLIGSPAITSRGMGVAEAREIGKIIGEALDDVGTRHKMDKLRGRVAELTSRFDVP